MIPFGEQKLVVELSLKEALALSSGAHFRQQPQLAASARIRRVGERKHYKERQKKTQKNT